MKLEAITKIAPVAMICLSVTAGAVYLYARDYRRAIYWFAAAIITGSVTF